MNAETYLMDLKVKLAVSLELIDIIEKEIKEKMSVNPENT
jgi:hypothetical protein